MACHCSLEAPDRLHESRCLPLRMQLVSSEKDADATSEPKSSCAVVCRFTQLNAMRPAWQPVCADDIKCSVAAPHRVLRTHSQHMRGHIATAAASAPPAIASRSEAEPSASSSGQPQLQLYNTMERRMQPFTPRSGAGKAVSMYVCGVTAYDFSHIGHARVYVAFDLLYRLLRQQGYDVHYVRNFTDIDDKIINRANEAGEDPLALSQRFIDEFHSDMAALGCLPPSHEPKATEHVQDMISTIQQIIDNGHAYEVDGNVFFDVKSADGYGRLSRHDVDSSAEGAPECLHILHSKQGVAKPRESSHGRKVACLQRKHS